jgi:hypothetical protein
VVSFRWPGQSVVSSVFAVVSFPLARGEFRGEYADNRGEFHISFPEALVPPGGEAFPLDCTWPLTSHGDVAGRGELHPARKLTTGRYQSVISEGLFW